MKKQVLFSLPFSLLSLISADAQTFFTIENNWENTSNKDQHSPLLSKKNDILFVQHMNLDNKY